MKLPKLEHVKYVHAKGKVYAYFNTGKKKDGRVVYFALPRPDDLTFYASYNSCRNARLRKRSAPYTVAKLCDDYQDSREFADLALGSQRAYRVYLRLIVELFGSAEVDELTRADVQLVLDGAKMGAGKQNLFVATLGAVYKWGRERDKTTGQPTKDIRGRKTTAHVPWPEHVLEAGLVAEDDRLRLAIALMFYTGQRIGDVCAMRWTSIKGGKIAITQQKTGKALKVPLIDALREELERTPKRGLTLLTNRVGGPVRTTNLRDQVKAFCAAQGEPDLVPHGLRKNAVNAFLLATCSVPETAAITGQTYQLVQEYAAGIDQERMADAAVLKMEQHRNRKTRENSGRKAADSRGSN